MSFNYNNGIFLPSSIINDESNIHSSSSSASVLMNNRNAMDISGTYACHRSSNPTPAMNNHCGCVECYNTAAVAAAANAISPSSDYSIGHTSCSSTTFAPSLKNTFSYGSSSINTNTNHHHHHQQQQMMNSSSSLMMNKNNMHFLKNNICNGSSAMISSPNPYFDMYASSNVSQKKNHIPLFVRLPPFPDFAEHHRFPKFPKFPKFRRQVTQPKMSTAHHQIIGKNTNIFNYGLKESQLRPNNMLQNNIPCPSARILRSKPLTNKSSVDMLAIHGNSAICNGCHNKSTIHFSGIHPSAMMCKPSSPPVLPTTLPPSLPFTLPLPLPPTLPSNTRETSSMSVGEQFCPSFFSSEPNRVFPQFGNSQNRNILSQFSHTTNNIIHHNNMLYIRRVSNGSGERSDESTDVEKPYACMICYRAFKRKHNMLIHQRVHTAEAFLCQFCEKPFARKSNLKQHLRVHTGERPFKCRSCSKAFTQSHSLKDHCKIHNSNESEKTMVMVGEC